MGKEDTAYSRGEEESNDCVKGKPLFVPEEEEDLNRQQEREKALLREEGSTKVKRPVLSLACGSVKDTSLGEMPVLFHQFMAT